MGRNNDSVIPDDVGRFGIDVATRVQAVLGTEFVGAYFANLEGAVPPRSVSLGQVSSEENSYWMVARDRNPKAVRFAPSPMAPVTASQRGAVRTE